MVTYHKNRHQGLSIIKFLIFAPSEMEDFICIYIYIRKKTSSGVNLACISQTIKKCFFPRQVRFTYIYIYTRFCLRTENRSRKTRVFEYLDFGVGWGGGGC